jgi:L-ribulose-5-phosphate 4-epimerase
MSLKNSALAYQALREECCEANRRLPELNIVDLTFGNVSVVDRAAGVFAIKPSGVPYETLQPADIVIVALDENPATSVVEGNYRPSSDTPTHKRLLTAFPTIGAVVHTHSRNATAFAQAARPIPCFGTTHADYAFGEIPLTREMTPAEVREDYEWHTGGVIIERLEFLDVETIPAVLLRSHAPFAWGPTAAKAVENAFALEIIAQMAAMTLALNPQTPPIPSHLHQKHFLRKHGTQAYYGQT